MAVKSVLDIDVNDEKFKRFAEQFAKYRAALDAMPEKWKKNNKGIMGSRDAAAGMAAYETTFSAQLNKNTKTLEQHGSLWKKIQTHTHNIKNDILSISKWIIGGTIGLEIADLFGLTALARSVSGQRTAALTSGTRFGDVQAFTKNLGRNMPGANAFISQAFLSSTPGTAQFSAGKIFHVDTDLPPLKFAEALYLAMQAKAKILHTGRFMQMYQKIVAPLGLGTGDIESMVRTSGPETQREIANTNKAAKELNVSNATAEAAQNFLSSLNTAVTTMGNQIFSALTPLLKPLENLMNSIVKLVREIVNSGAAKKMIDGLSEGLQKLANYLNSGDTQKAFSHFLSELNELADSAGTVAHVVAAPFKLFDKAAKALGDAIGWLATHATMNGVPLSDMKFVIGEPGVAPGFYSDQELEAIHAKQNPKPDMYFPSAPGAAGARTHIAIPPLHLHHLVQINVEPGTTIIAGLSTLGPFPQYAGA